MATEEVQQQQEAQAEPQGEAKETDWKAEARKWEARAKKSEKAEKELSELKQAQMTEHECIVARAEAAEKELEVLRAEAQRQAEIKEVASQTGVPESVLQYCADREAMEGLAAEYSKTQQVHAAPTAQASRIVNGVGPKKEPRDLFAEYAAQQLNR